MNLTATLKVLRTRKNVNGNVAASQTLPKGLTIEAKLEGKWLLSRPGVKPSNLEIEIVARDAGMQNGFRVRTGPAKDPADQNMYSLITPANDDPDFATTKLCPACCARSIMQDVDGAGDYCPECGHNTNTTKALTPLEPEAVQAAMFETLGSEPVPTVETRDAKARATRAFFDSPRRSATALELEAKNKDDTQLVQLEDRALLLHFLMEGANHLTTQGQEARYFTLANMTDQALMLEAQGLSGGVAWRAYLEEIAVDEELEVLA